MYVYVCMYMFLILIALSPLNQIEAYYHYSFMSAIRMNSLEKSQILTFWALSRRLKFTVDAIVLKSKMSELKELGLNEIEKGSWVFKVKLWDTRAYIYLFIK